MNGYFFIMLSAAYWIYLIWSAGRLSQRKEPTNMDILLLSIWGILPAFYGFMLVMSQ